MIILLLYIESKNKIFGIHYQMIQNKTKEMSLERKEKSYCSLKELGETPTSNLTT